MRHFKNLAHLVKKKRLAHPQSLSQTDLSEKLGYKNGQFISNVERSLCHLPFKILPQVCEVLLISPEELKEAMLKDYESTIEYYLANKNVDENNAAANSSRESSMTEQSSTNLFN